MGLVLLLGGVRSGKSRLAVRMGVAWGGPVVVIATAEARDEEMARRIQHHRQERPAGWATVEEPLDVEAALAGVPKGARALVDCLTLWVSNLVELGLPDPEIEDRARRAAVAAARREAGTVAVTNEIGSGVVPVNALARRFVEIHGRVNAIWASSAEQTLLVIAGRALSLADPETLV